MIKWQSFGGSNILPYTLMKVDTLFWKWQMSVEIWDSSGVKIMHKSCWYIHSLYNGIGNIWLKVFILNMIGKNYNFITLWIFYIYVDINFFHSAKSLQITEQTLRWNWKEKFDWLMVKVAKPQKVFLSLL